MAAKRRHCRTPDVLRWAAVTIPGRQGQCPSCTPPTHGCGACAPKRAEASAGAALAATAHVEMRRERAHRERQPAALARDARASAWQGAAEGRGGGRQGGAEAASALAYGGPGRLSKRRLEAPCALHLLRGLAGMRTLADICTLLYLGPACSGMATAALQPPAACGHAAAESARSSRRRRNPAPCAPAGARPELPALPPPPARTGGPLR